MPKIFLLINRHYQRELIKLMITMQLLINNLCLLDKYQKQKDFWLLSKINIYLQEFVRSTSYRTEDVQHVYINSKLKASIISRGENFMPYRAHIIEWCVIFTGSFTEDLTCLKKKFCWEQRAAVILEYENFIILSLLLKLTENRCK